MSTGTIIAIAVAVAVVSRGLRILWPRVLRDPEVGLMWQSIGATILLIVISVIGILLGVQTGSAAVVTCGAIAALIGTWMLVGMTLAMRWYRRTGTKPRYSGLLERRQLPVRAQSRHDPDRFLVEMGFRDGAPIGVVYDRSAHQIGEPISVDEELRSPDWNPICGPIVAETPAISREAGRLFETHQQKPHALPS